MFEVSEFVHKNTRPDYFTIGLPMRFQSHSETVFICFQQNFVGCILWHKHDDNDVQRPLFVLHSVNYEYLNFRLFTESKESNKVRSKRGKVTRASSNKIKSDVKQHLDAIDPTDAESMPLAIQTNFLSESVRRYLELGRAIPGKIKLIVFNTNPTMEFHIKLINRIILIG